METNEIIGRCQIAAALRDSIYSSEMFLPHMRICPGKSYLKCSYHMLSRRTEFNSFSTTREFMPARFAVMFAWSSIHEVRLSRLSSSHGCPFGQHRAFVQCTRSKLSSVGEILSILNVRHASTWVKLIDITFIPYISVNF